MLAAVPAMLAGLIIKILLPVAALWGSFELVKFIGEKIHGRLDESGWNTKLFDAVDSIKTAFGDAWKAVGDGIGTVIDGMSTTWKSITDGFTKALDGFTAFPAKIGEFFTGLDSAMRNIPVIGKAYGAALDAAKATVGEAASSFQQGKTGDTSAPAASATQAIARDVGKGVALVGAIGSQARAGFDMAHGDGTAQAAPSCLLQRAAGGAAGTAADWVLGQTSKTYESGRGGAGTVSTGNGDRGGASYGTYQLASKTGTLEKFMKASVYASQFEGLTPGSPEFNAKWKGVAKADPLFGGAQHDFMRATHFELAMEALKDAGIDLTNHGLAVQDALWSTATQFGPGSAKRGDGAFGRFSKSLAGKDVANLSQAEIVTAVQNFKAANNDSLFRSSSAAVRAGTLSRAASEKSALLQLSSAGT